MRKNTDYMQYVAELVQEWGYTEDDAKARNPATMAWMAIPLINQRENRLEGVVYLDSVTPHFFTEARKRLILHACVTIASYVAQRYG